MRERSRTQVVFSLAAIPVLLGIACLWAAAGVEAVQRTGSDSLPAGSMLQDEFTATPTPTRPRISPTPTNTRPYRTRTPTPTRTRPADAWANLSITKELSPPPQGPLAPGTYITITLAVHNAGPSEASDVGVLDVFWPGKVRLTACGTVTGSCNLQRATGPLGVDAAEFQLGSLPADSTAWLTVWAQVLTDTCGTVMANSASVFSPVPDPDHSDNIANLDWEIAACEGPEADLFVAKGTDAQQPVAPGGQIQYNIVAGGAENFVVMDVLPPNVTYVRGSACWKIVAHRPPNDVLRCEVSNYTALDLFRASIEVQVDEDACGRIRNLVEVHGDTADPNPGNNAAWLDTVVGPCGRPAVLVTKRLLDPQGGVALLGDLVTFEIVVSNIGNSLFEFVALTDAYDSSILEFVASSREPTQVMVGPVQGLLAWADLTGPPPYGFGSPLPPGGSFAITVQFRAIESGGTQDCAQVVAEGEEGGAADENCAGLRIRDPTVDLQVDKRLIQPITGPASPGQTVRFEIRLENTGSVPITALGLHDDYDTAYLSFLGADFAPDDSADDGALDWSNLTAPSPQGFGHPLLPGQVVTFVIGFRARAATPPGQPTLNCVLASYRQGEDAVHATSPHCARVVIEQQGPTSTLTPTREGALTVTPTPTSTREQPGTLTPTPTSTRQGLGTATPTATWEGPRPASPTPSPTGQGAIHHVYLPIMVRRLGR